MPIQTYHTEADFQRDYDSYTREVQLPVHQRHAEKYIEILKLKPSDRIVIVGCGFGWTLEVLEQHGFDSIAGVEISNYILSKLAEDKEIYKGSADISASLGLFKPDIIITEYVLDSYYDEEIPKLLEPYSYAKLTAHLVKNIKDDPYNKNFNTKSLEDWKALLPNHIFISGGNYKWL